MLNRRGALVIDDLDSSWIKRIWAVVNVPGLKKNVLTFIETKDGRTVVVGYIPRALFLAWADADSVGKFYNAYIKAQGYEFHPDQREELLGKKVAQALASKQRTREAELYREWKARRAEAEAKKKAGKKT